MQVQHKATPPATRSFRSKVVNGPTTNHLRENNKYRGLTLDLFTRFLFPPPPNFRLLGTVNRFFSEALGKSSAQLLFDLLEVMPPSVLLKAEVPWKARWVVGVIPSRPWVPRLHTVRINLDLKFCSIEE